MQVNISAREGGRTEREYPIAAGGLQRKRRSAGPFPAAMRKEIDTSNRKIVRRYFMGFQKWPKREPLKNFFPVPNEIFILGLSPGEIAVYCYLLRTEDRQTFQCYPSYEAIGKAVGVGKNTVAKYVRSLEEKGLIRTQRTKVLSRDGKTLNGNLLFTICPIQAAVQAFYERQLRMADLEMERYQARQRMDHLHKEEGETVC